MLLALVGTAPLSQFKRFKRWDAVFNIHYAQHAADCDRLVARFAKEELHDMIMAMPDQDRRLFNGLICGRFDQPVSVTSVCHLSHEAAAVYLVLLHKRNRYQDNLKDIYATARERACALRTVRDRVTQALAATTMKGTDDG